MTKVLVQVPRMQQVIESMQAYEMNQLKWESISEFLSVFSSLSHKEHVSLDKIAASELEILLESVLSLPIKSLFLPSLYGLIDELAKLKQQISQILTAEFNEAAYKEILGDITSSYFCLSVEEQTIEKRLRAFKEMSEYFFDGHL